MDINCTDLDRLIDDSLVAIETDAGFVISISILCVLSLVVIADGERFARPLAGIVAGSIAAVGLYVLTTGIGDVPCVARIVVSLVGSIAACLLAVCLLKGGLFAIGAGGFGTVSHFGYKSVPWFDQQKPPFLILGMSGYYYIAILVGGLLGAIVSVLLKKQFLRITTSLVGSGGIALATHLVAAKTNTVVPSLAYVVILFVFTGIGVLLQTYISKRRRGRRRRRRRRDDDDDDDRL